jgi:hypothetical protein
MGMYEQAFDAVDYSQLTSSEADVYQAYHKTLLNEKRLLEEKNAYKLDFRLNASLTYIFPINSKSNLRTTVYADNLVGSRKKYYVSTGSNSFIPSRLKFIEEPRTIGLKLLYNYQ